MNKAGHKADVNIILIALFLVLLCSCSNPGIPDAEKEMARITNKWAPDGRVGLCAISVARGKGRSLILTGETMFRGARDEAIAWAVKTGKPFIDSLRVLPDTIMNPKYMGLVTCSVINMRRSPAHESELLSQAVMGTPVRVLKRNEDWLFIQTPDKYLGWTEESSVILMNYGEWVFWQHSDRLIYLANTGWIYGSEDRKSIVGDIVAGAIVSYQGDSPDGWMAVLLPDGRTGLIAEDQAMDYTDWKSQIRCTPEGLIGIARTLMGVPYLWGGTSPKAADCSGYIQSVFFRNGIILPRDASQQSELGVNIDITQGVDSLRIGDLLFFGTQSNSSLKVTHVGMYMGDTEFIHESGMVMTGSLDSSRSNYDQYRKKSLLLAKRITSVRENAGIVPISGHPWY